MSYQAQIWQVDSRPIVLQHVFRFCQNLENIGTFSLILKKQHFSNFGGQNVGNRKIRDGILVALLILHLFKLNYFSLSSKL